MQTYEVLKDKRLDYYLAVPKDILPKFLNILAKKSQSALKALEENPNGKSPYDDSCSPLPNMTFEYDNYQYFVRRDAYKHDFEEFQKAWESLQNEGYEGKPIFGLQLYHIPYYDHYTELSGYDEFNGKIVDIAYETICDFESFECECVRKTPDFSNLPSDTTREFVESLFKVRKSDDKQVGGTLFGYFVFNMEAKVVENMRRILPSDMLEYLENMNSYHAIFHDREDEDIDGCETYILYNVPLENYDHNFFTADYNDENALMGARFANFFNKHTDIDEYGDFAIYMSPQPGILQVDDHGFNTFTTPWEIVYYLCGDENQEVNLMWGNELYYMDDPFHLQIQRFINISPEAQRKAYFNNIDNNKYLTGTQIGRQKEPNAATHEDTGISQSTFEKFLIEQGYSEHTPSGKPSTVYDYLKRIERVCKDEGLSLDSLEENIDRFVAEYGKGGIKEEQGNASHSAVINALKAFQKFIKCDSKDEVGQEVKEEKSLPDNMTTTHGSFVVDPAEAIQEDYIVCCICGEKRQSLTNKHLATHGLTQEEYKKQCGYNPDQPLISLNKLNESRRIIEESKNIRE